jgi:hypothetical protein
VSAVPLADQLACVQRELRLRRRVYDRLVVQGKLKPETACREIRALEAVIDTLQRLEQQERLL